MRPRRHIDIVVVKHLLKSNANAALYLCCGFSGRLAGGNWTLCFLRMLRRMVSSRRLSVPEDGCSIELVNPQLAQFDDIVLLAAVGF